MQAEKAAPILAAALDGATVAVGDRGDTYLVVRTNDGRDIEFDVRWAGEGWPADVRHAARDVPVPWPANVVIVARRLSTGSIEWLRDRGGNWADAAGQARIIGPDGLIVIREPSPNGAPSRRAPVFVWSPSTMSVAEAILARADEPLRVGRLATASGWSVPQTATVLQQFDGQGWTTKRGAARGPRAYRELVDADGMLAAWSEAVATGPRHARVAHRVTDDVMGLLRNTLAPALDARVRWAASGWAALELAAPFVTTTPALHIYVAEDGFAGPLSAAIADAGLREVDEGGRVVFWRAERHMFGLVERRNGLPIASAPRIYADLSSMGARGQDAADHIKAELIDPLHHGAPAAMPAGEATRSS